MAEGLGGWLASPRAMVVVEPEAAPAVAAALAAHRVVRVDGDLETTAEMLSCGEASAPALRVLRRHRVEAIAVSEAALDRAPALLAACGGPHTTSSGAAGFAGVMVVQDSRPALPTDVRILILITERERPAEPAGAGSLPATRCGRESIHDVAWPTSHDRRHPVWRPADETASVKDLIYRYDPRTAAIWRSIIPAARGYDSCRGRECGPPVVRRAKQTGGLRPAHEGQQR